MKSTGLGKRGISPSHTRDRYVYEFHNIFPFALHLCHQRGGMNSFDVAVSKQCKHCFHDKLISLFWKFSQKSFHRKYHYYFLGVPETVAVGMFVEMKWKFSNLNSSLLRIHNEAVCKNFSNEAFDFSVAFKGVHPFLKCFIS